MVQEGHVQWTLIIGKFLNSLVIISKSNEKLLNSIILFYINLQLLEYKQRLSGLINNRKRYQRHVAVVWPVNGLPR